jgi:RNA polymerase sigma-70 factor (ECF subfamily)
MARTWLATQTRELVPDQPGADDHAAQPLDVAEVFKAHAGFVWRVLQHLGVRVADLEDATQEVFVVVHRRGSEYHDRDRVRAWLYAICVRVAKDARRRIRRRREDLPGELPEAWCGATQLSELANQRSLALGKRLLAALPEKQRTVFLLYELEQMSMTEVALALECPVQTAYARLHKARERICAEVARATRRGELA